MPDNIVKKMLGKNICSNIKWNTDHVAENIVGEDDDKD
jgi:hypothetical protein